MKFLANLFKWFTAKNKNSEEIQLGYVLDGEPKTIQDIEKVFNAFKLTPYFTKIKLLVKSRIDLTLNPTDELKITITQSKIGGQPCLAKGTVWPKNENGKPLSFIAQLNLEEVSPVDKSGLLPKQGLLSFFYCADQEAWGFDPKDKQRFKVLFTDKLSELVKQDFPADLGKQSIFKPNTLSFKDSLSLPTLDEDAIATLIEDGDTDNYAEASNGYDNQILGYANCIQNAMELECQLVTNGLYCGDATAYRSQSRKELEAGKTDWVLLLQVDSDENKTGMMWGDCGRIYFWIKKQDLAKKNFDNTWCILQCY